MQAARCSGRLGIHTQGPGAPGDSHTGIWTPEIHTQGSDPRRFTHRGPAPEGSHLGASFSFLPETCAFSCVGVISACSWEDPWGVGGGVQGPAMQGSAGSVL